MKQSGMKINELILKVQEELKRAQYSEFRLNKFLLTWERLKEYLIQKNEPVLNAKIGLNFLEDKYGITVFKNLPGSLATCVRAENVLTDYQLHRIILARATRKVHTYMQFQKLFQGYIDQPG